MSSDTQRSKDSDDNGNQSGDGGNVAVPPDLLNADDLIRGQGLPGI